MFHVKQMMINIQNNLDIAMSSFIFCSIYLTNVTGDEITGESGQSPVLLSTCNVELSVILILT